MTRFDLHRKFDAVVCLFSSIGYVRTVKRLERAIGCMAHHLSYGGVLIIEPWFDVETWHPKSVYATFVDEPETKVLDLFK